MSYTIPVKGIGGDWLLTLPNYMTIHQGDGKQPIHLDGTDPITIDIHYTPDVLFNGDFHGMLSIEGKDLPGTVDDTQVANGLRGTVKFNFHNDLDVAMNATAVGTTIIIFMGANSDNFGADPANGGHPQYVHLHEVGAADFPGLTVSPHTMNNWSETAGTAGAINHIDLGGTLAAHSDHPFGDMTFHQRDRNGTIDDFFLTVFPTADGLNADAVTAAKVQYDNLPKAHDYTNANAGADSFYYYIFRGDKGDFYTGHVIENTGTYQIGSTVTVPHGSYQILFEQPYGFDVSTGLDPSGNPWGTAYDDGRVYIDTYHKGVGDWKATYFGQLHDTVSNTISAGTGGLGTEVDYVDQNGHWAMIGRGGEYTIA